MTQTPRDIEIAVERVRELLVRMAQEGTLGEVAVIVGGNYYQLEERITRRPAPIKRQASSHREIVRVR